MKHRESSIRVSARYTAGDASAREIALFSGLESGDLDKALPRATSLELSRSLLPFRARGLK